MENLQTIFLTPGETTLGKFFQWVRNTLVRNANKQWVVEVAPGRGSGTFRDSDKKVTCDLALLGFTVVAQGANTTVVFDGIKTYTVNATAGAGVSITNTDGFLDIVESPTGTFVINLKEQASGGGIRLLGVDDSGVWGLYGTTECP